MNITTLPYLNQGPINKIVVSLNNAVSAGPSMAVAERTGRSPHYIVDEKGILKMMADPKQAVVPFQGKNLTSPHRQSPAVWVEFTGTGPEDLEGVDVLGILDMLCAEYGVKSNVLEFYGELALGAFTEAEGIVQRKYLRGHTSSTELPIPKRYEVSAELPSLYEEELEELETLELSADVFNPEENEVVDTTEWPEFKGRPLKPGSKSEKIALIAEAHNLDSIEYDEDIEVLVTSTQEDAGLEANGVIDAATWAALNPNK